MEIIGESDQGLNEVQNRALQGLLTKFASVFCEISGLPSAQVMRLCCYMGANPVSVRPYITKMRFKDKFRVYFSKV